MVLRQQVVQEILYSNITQVDLPGPQTYVVLAESEVDSFNCRSLLYGNL